MNNIEYIKDNKINKVSLKDFNEKLKINSVIRIQEKDFNNIDTSNQYYMHFNSRKAGHEIGKKYAIIKIVKPGGIDNNNKEFFPVFDLSKILIGYCIDFKFQDFKEVNKKDFEFSMKNIKNISELKEEIIFRYKKFNKDKSNEEIFKKGVSLTKLKIEKITS